MINGRGDLTPLLVWAAATPRPSSLPLRAGAASLPERSAASTASAREGESASNTKPFSRKLRQIKPKKLPTGGRGEIKACSAHDLGMDLGVCQKT